MENQELIPIEEIREMYQNGVLVKKPQDNNSSLMHKFDDEFDKFIKSDDEVQKDVKKHNKKTFKLFRKRKEALNKDETSTDIYQVRYDRETWYYKRHKDTIDKYIQKDEKKKAKQDKSATTVEVTYVDEPREDIIRIGLFKMLLIVWFDLFVDFIGKVIFLPIHLLRYVSELFFKMKKSIAITIIIIVGVVLVTLGLVFGINALMNYAKNLT